MQKAFYDRLARPYEENEKKKQLLIRTNKWITNLCYIMYPVLLFALLVTRDERFLRVLLVPLVTFVAVTIFRQFCNAKRPYELWNSPPLMPKDTKGNSFPSRHVFSIYIIAMSVWYIWWPGGVILCVIGVFLGSVRVIARVHFVKDVIAGAGIAIALGILGFWVI